MNRSKTVKLPKLGKHLVCDMWGVDDIPNKGESVIRILKYAAKKANATSLEHTYHEFQPSGVTAVLLLSESHISLHSWPEHNYVSIDVFTCGEKVSPELAIDYLVSVLNPSKVNIRQIERGDLNVN